MEKHDIIVTNHILDILNVFIPFLFNTDFSLLLFWTEIVFLTKV